MTLPFADPTTPINLSTEYTNTPTTNQKTMQSIPLNFSIKYADTQTPDLASSEMAPLLIFQSNFARQLSQSEDMQVNP